MIKILTFVSIILFLILLYVAIKFIKYDGTLIINQNNPEKDFYRFIINKPIEKIPRKKFIIIKVKIDN